MPVAFCYILYSPGIDKFYFGSTSTSVEERLNKHNTNYYPDSWSRKGIPWQLFFTIECNSPIQAYLIEEHIQKMKNRIYYNNFKNYPEMVDKLRKKFE